MNGAIYDLPRRTVKAMSGFRRYETGASFWLGLRRGTVRCQAGKCFVRSVMVVGVLEAVEDRIEGLDGWRKVVAGVEFVSPCTVAAPGGAVDPGPFGRQPSVIYSLNPDRLLPARAKHRYGPRAPTGMHPLSCGSAAHVRSTPRPPAPMPPRHAIPRVPRVRDLSRGTKASAGSPPLPVAA